MSGLEWKPGDVAAVTIPGRPETQMVRYDTGSERGWYGGAGSAFTDGRSHFSDEGSARDATARPLVVIDPEDREQVEAFALALIAGRKCDKSGLHVCNDTACVTERSQAALRSLVTPPKPERPSGWGAVVEDNTGALWTLIAPEADAWRNYARGARNYDQIAAVHIHHTGVTP